MSIARIYRPDKNPMQAGKAGMQHWRLEFTADSPLYIEPLMGWTGMRDMKRELQLTFATKELAIAYANKHGLAYEVTEPHKRSQVKKTYADNFKYTKRHP